MDHTAHEATATADHVPHVLPLRTYLKVWGALLVLTAVTVGVSYFDFGSFNLVVALAVATVKATLVALVFMHLLYDGKFNAIVMSFSVLFLALFVGLTFLDTNTRGMGDAIEGMRPRDPAQPFVNGKPDTVPIFEKARPPPAPASR